MLDHQKQIDILREALTNTFLTLNEVYKYALMDSKTLEKVKDAQEEAESALSLTD